MLQVRSMSDSNQLALSKAMPNLSQLSPEDVKRQKQALLTPLREVPSTAATPTIAVTPPLRRDADDQRCPSSTQRCHDDDISDEVCCCFY